MSVLQALNHTSSKNPQIQKLLLKHHTISEQKSIIYCWIPSHTGIFDNEKVDKNAKELLNLEETVFKIPYVIFKPFYYPSTFLTNGKQSGTERSLINDQE